MIDIPPVQIVLEYIIKVSYYLLYKNNNMTVSVNASNDMAGKELIVAHKNVNYGVFQPTPFHVIEDIMSYAKVKPNDRLFDFGSGDGLVSRLLASRNISVDGFEEDQEVYTWGTLASSFFEEAMRIVLTKYDTIDKLDVFRSYVRDIENLVKLKYGDAFTSGIDFSVYNFVYLYYPEPVGLEAKEEFNKKLNALLSNSDTGLQADSRLLVLRQGAKKPINLSSFVLESAPRDILTHSAKAHHIVNEDLRKRGVVDSMMLSIYKVVK